MSDHSTTQELTPLPTLKDGEYTVELFGGPWDRYSMWTTEPMSELLLPCPKRNGQAWAVYKLTRFLDGKVTYRFRGVRGMMRWREV